MRHRLLQPALCARIGLLLLPLLLGACAGPGGPRGPLSDGPPRGDVDISAIADAVPRVEPRSRYGNPDSYVVNGRRYHVMDTDAGYMERGIASWYGSKFHGRLTSTREPYDMYAMTAAHKTLPLPTYARVTNLRNGRSVVVRINDRGPFVDNRIIDLSYVAAKKLDIIAEGTGLVEVRVVNPGGEAPVTRMAGNGTEPVPAPGPRVAGFIPAARAAPAATGDPRMYLQVGAFADRGNANSLARRLADRLGTDIRIHPTPSGAHTLYRVRIGPLGSVADVDRLSARVAALGLEPPHVVVE
jgi:rare lipoprotein A